MPANPSDAWNVELVRFTAFLSVPPADVNAWWQTAAGEMPETTSATPREGKQRFEGPFGDAGRFILLTEFNRVDWIAHATVNVEQDYAQPPNIGGMDMALATFSERIERWLVDAPRCVRIAFGTVFQLPVQDRIAGYIKLSQLLTHLKVDDPQNTSDLLYQINKRRTSRVITGLTINRLQKWSVLVFNLLRMQLAGTSPTTLAVQPALADGELNACRLEVDISSDGARTEPLPPEQLIPLWRELRDSGAEISRIGDVG